MNYFTSQNDALTSSAAPIGALLRARGFLSEADLNRGLLVQREIGGLIGQVLQRIGAITEEALLQCLSEQLLMPIMAARDLPKDRRNFVAAAGRLALSPEWLCAHEAAVWTTPDGAVKVLASNPVSATIREMIARAAFAIGEDRVEYFLGDAQAVETATANFKAAAAAETDDEFGDAARLRELAEEAPIIDYVNAMISRAIRESASDIHVEGGNPTSAVRYRIDGVLHERARMGQSQFEAVVSRIKLIAGMDIAERRLPQDGRSTARFAGNEIDLRVSSVPSTWGESIVIRLLRKQKELPDLGGLGLGGRTGAMLRRILSHPNGVFLVTGPTGSGKSTTLYRGLETINDGKRKIITIEDPVEYDVGGITQIQVKPEIGYDFAKGLRAILRQDPDVIMVGEIRDQETATIAAQAAMTGHLVLSTLHTNSALAAITRLRNIGLESYLIAASLRGLMAQRLVRRLCDQCADPVANPVNDPEFSTVDALVVALPDSDRSAARWHRPVGCPACAETGYRGRVALSEIVETDDRLREAITSDATVPALLEIARAQGFLTLFEDGLQKARRGETSLDEVMRVCSGDYV